MRRWHRVVLKGGLLAVSAALALGAGELLFRAAALRGYRDHLAALPAGDWQPLPDARVFGLRPDHLGKGGFLQDPRRRFDFRTNALGLRGAEIAPRRPGVARVLVLGDSYVFGWAVEESETLPAQLERRLVSAGVDAEVLNGGVPSYNTEQEDALFERLLPELRPDLVLVGFVMNDAEMETTLATSPAVTYRYARSWAWERLKLEVRRRWPASERWLPSRLNAYDRDYLRSFSPGSPKRADCRAALGRLADRARRAGVPMLLVILPDFSQGFGPRYPFESIHATVAEWAEEVHVDHVDLLPLFRGRDAGRLRVPGDGHPNAEALGLVADALRPWIEARLAAPPP